jgi:simple sugar transport system ATP-binding protein
MRDASVLILDEPTAVLTPPEIDDLVQVMRRLRDSGTSIVFITHKLKEVRALADRITVIRRGKVVGEATGSMSEGELASMMVGRQVRLTIDKAPATPGDVVLEVEDLSYIDPAGVLQVDGVSFQVRAGEIVALAGVQGNGQTELTECVLGLEQVADGTLRFKGRDVTHLTVDQRLELGVGYVPEDRMHDGLVGSFTVAENLVLDLFERAPFGRGLRLDLAEIARNAKTRVEEFDVRTQSVDDPASTLSGGNQQKVVLARELSRPLDLLVVAQPTRGLDVGSMEFVHQRIVEERDKGSAVLLISTELEEILGLADRILVMYRGKVIGELEAASATAEQVGLLMAGSTAGVGDGGVDAASGSGAA